MAITRRSLLRWLGLSAISAPLAVNTRRAVEFAPMPSICALMQLDDQQPRWLEGDDLLEVKIYYSAEESRQPDEPHSRIDVDWQSFAVGESREIAEDPFGMRYFVVRRIA